MGLIFLALEPWAGWSGVGLGSLAPEVPLPIFIHPMWVWDPGSASPHMSASSVPIWMNVTSLSPWLLDSHTAQFYDDSG